MCYVLSTYSLNHLVFFVVREQSNKYSLSLMNSFNKTKTAVFPCRLCFPRAFPIISFFVLIILENFEFTKEKQLQ